MSLEAFIYYRDEEQAFERAARTLAGAENPNGSRLFLEVETKDEFVDAWSSIAEEAAASDQKVSRVCLLTHASKEDDGNDGLEFASLEGESGTFTRDDMSTLDLLPWQDSSQVRLELFGCRTSLRAGRGWCPAEHLAQVQPVPCRGETGYSYFSKAICSTNHRLPQMS